MTAFYRILVPLAFTLAACADPPAGPFPGSGFFSNDSGSRADAGADEDASAVGLIDGGPQTSADGSTSCEETCGGCCDAEGVCQVGEIDTMCGAGGASCSDCGDDSCSEGMCVTEGCTSNDQCGDGFACSSEGMCRYDRDARWSVTVGTLRVSLTREDGTSWDGEGDQPDPFVQIWLENGDDARTSHENDTDMIVFDETIFNDLNPEELLGTLEIEVRDNDRFRSDDTMVRHEAPVTVDDLLAGSILIEKEASGDDSRLYLELYFDVE